MSPPIQPEETAGRSWALAFNVDTLHPRRERRRGFESGRLDVVMDTAVLHAVPRSGGGLRPEHIQTGDGPESVVGNFFAGGGTKGHPAWWDDAEGSRRVQLRTFGSALPRLVVGESHLHEAFDARNDHRPGD